MSKAFQGSQVNGSGTRVAAVQVLGTNPSAVSNPDNDSHLLVPLGAMQIPVKAAINMGILNRNGATLTENKSAGGVW